MHAEWQETGVGVGQLAPVDDELVERSRPDVLRAPFVPSAAGRRHRYGCNDPLGILEQPEGHPLGAGGPHAKPGVRVDRDRSGLEPSDHALCPEEPATGMPARSPIRTIRFAYTSEVTGFSSSERSRERAARAAG